MLKLNAQGDLVRPAGPQRMHRLEDRQDEVIATAAELRAAGLVPASEVERLRRDCAEAYQAVGAAIFGDPAIIPPYTDDDVIRLLDNLGAAANGTPRPHDDLLPWPAALKENEHD